MAGEFRWAVLGVLEDLEVQAFRPIKPEDDALAYFKGLVATSNVCTCRFNSRSALCPVRVRSRHLDRHPKSTTEEEPQ
jgi:hypothetical protein